MNHEQILATVGATVGVVVALLTLGLARAPGCRGLRWLGLIALSAGAVGVLRTAAEALDDVASVAWLTQVGVALSGVMLWAWVRYEASDADRPVSLVDRVCGPIALVVSGLALVPSLLIGTRVVRHGDGWSDVSYVDVVPTALGAATFAIMLAVVCLLLRHYVRRWQGGQPMAGAHAAGLGGLLVAGTFDAIDGSSLHRGMHLMPLGLLWAMGFIGVALVGQFVLGARALSAISSRLERDVSERSAELATARATLVETQELVTLGRLSAAVAHEINNPVAVVAANLAYLRDTLTSVSASPATGETLEAIQDTLASVDRISGIVRQLGEAGELASHGGTIFPVELAGTIGSAAAAARLRFDSPPQVDIDVVGLFHVSSQEASLRQVLASLIVVAMEALAATEGPGAIRVSVRKHAERIQVRIEDNAPELDDVLRERRFKPYFDPRPEIVRSDVGLSVSLALIRMLGADLVLERSDVNGTVVRIDLRAVAPPATRSDSPASSRTPRARVLVVDDDVLTRIGLRRLLGREYVIEEAGTVERALSLVRELGEDLDAIVCDVVMPDGGAETLIAALELTSPRLASAVLLLTGGAIDAATGALIAAHAARVVRKPVDVVTLRSQIERVRVHRRVQGLPGRSRG